MEPPEIVLPGLGGPPGPPAAAAHGGAGGPAGSPSYRRALAGLTEPQRRAVASASTAVCVRAGAGSGKTRVLTLRAAGRIVDGSADADHTLVATFTRKAADELRARLRAFGVTVATPATRGGVRGPGVRAGTLHQLALTLLRRHALDAGRPPPALVEHRYRLIGTVVDDAATVPAVDTEIGWAKARCLTPDTYPAAAAASGRPLALPAEQIADHFRSYQHALARRHALDLDDVLVASADLVLDDAAFAGGVRWRYRHLLVDEFQDVNPAQYRLIEALMGGRGDLFVVGDPNQAVYGWNGADPGLLTRLPSMVSAMEMVRLDENHRCTPQVVAAAAAALGSAAHGLPRSSRPDGPMPVVTAYEDEGAEAEGVAATLLRWAAGGRPWAELAVLARTNDQLSVVAGALKRAGVPFRTAPGAESPSPRATGAGRQGKAGAGAPGDRGAVELATFHRAKGLEWHSVHVVGIEDGLVPIYHASSMAAREEERRLLYVALTRASDQLHCSWARFRQTAGGRRVERQPSPWLAAVAQVAIPGTARTGPVDAGLRIAELRANLGR